MNINDTSLFVEDFNDDFGNIMDEIHEFYVFGRDYYLSLREQFTADLVRDFINNEQVIVEGAFTNTIKKIIDGIIKFIKTMWKKFIGLFTKASNNVIEKVNNDDKKPLIPDELKKAVEDKDKFMCIALITDAMLTGVLWYKDVKFKQSDAMLEYVKRKLPSVMEPYDGRELDMDKSHWDKDFLVKDRVRTSTNFSQERYDYHKKVILYVTSKPNWKKEKSKEKYSKPTWSKTYKTYDYMLLLSNKKVMEINNLCTTLYIYASKEVDNIEDDIIKLMIRYEPGIEPELQDDYANYDPSKHSDYMKRSHDQHSTEIVTRKFKVDNINDITQQDIRNFILDGEKKTELSVGYLNNCKDFLVKYVKDYTEKVKRNEKEINKVVDKLKNIKNSIEKNENALGRYNNQYAQNYFETNKNMQKIVIDFLKHVQSNIYDCMTFQSKCSQALLGIVNEGITFINNL